MPLRSRVYRRRPEPPSPEVIAELESYEIAWLADAVGLGVMDPGIRALHRLPRIAGTALTVNVTPGDFGLISYAVEAARAGDILVIGGGGLTRRAYWGDYFSRWAQNFGVKGAIVDGAARDSNGFEAIGFPVFARAVTPYQPALHGPSEVNVPVSCGGVAVLPGDVIVADNEGIIVLPLRHLDEALANVRAKIELEKTIMPTPAGRAEYAGFYRRGGFEEREDIDVLDLDWTQHD
jgi:4-hydroxy-4-methyl-2-oxoglutarate aldolase